MHVARVDFDEARRLADLGGIQQDLLFVRGALTRLAGIINRQDADLILIQAYWTAALVVYVRCFATGKRCGLSESIFDGIDGDGTTAIEVHRHFKDLRDKHVAHSVNPFEQVEVGLVLTAPETGERKVEGVATLAMKLVSLTREGVESLLELTRIAGKWVAAEGGQLESAVLEAGKALDVDSLYDTAGLRLVAPGLQQAGKARSS